MTGTSAMNGEAMMPTTAIVRIAAQQVGSARAAASPARSDENSPPLCARGGAGSRMKASAATTARNDTALATNATG